MQFGHVTTLIGENVIAAYSEKFSQGYCIHLPNMKGIHLMAAKTFLERGNFLKICEGRLLRYPVGRRFQQNHSILHKTSKWPPFLGREIFSFENWQEYIA